MKGWKKTKKQYRHLLSKALCFCSNYWGEACNLFIWNNFIETKSIRFSKTVKFNWTVCGAFQLILKCTTKLFVSTAVYICCAFVCVSIQSSLCLGCVFQLQQPDCSSPVFMKGLFRFNDAFFCILCEKRAAVTQRLGVCSVAWVWLWDSLRCSCIQEAGGRHARVEYTQHAALRWFLLF